jgi:Fe2+ transport system protein FeoA
MKAIDLTQVGPGKQVRVSRLDCAPGTCQRLREMGFCENALVRKIRGGAERIFSGPPASRPVRR